MTTGRRSRRACTNASNRDRHALDHVQPVVGGASRGDERRLVDFLVVPTALQRRFPGEDDERQMRAHGCG